MKNEIKTKEQAINILIKDSDSSKISDGYNTFEELYKQQNELHKHQIELFITICRIYSESYQVWKCKDEISWYNNTMEDRFILGIFKKNGSQITYHIPMSKWDECDFAQTIESDDIPKWDGHTPDDILDRLKTL